MRRFLIVPVALLAATPVALAAAAPKKTTTAAAPRARLRAFVCQTALDPPARAVSVEAVMRPVPSTQTMALRFDLLGKTKGSSTWTPLRYGDLGTWRSPPTPTLGQRPGDVWVLGHPVTDLPAPARYRFRVWFRWTGPHDRVLQTVQLLSPVCYEPERRPDLFVSRISIAVVVNHPRLDQYTATIKNAGATAAGPFDVRFETADGSTVTTRSVLRLGPHASRQVVFVGPACTAANAPTVTVDPEHRVDDLNSANNSLSVPPACPQTTTG
jgi:hypothetical protein